MRELFKILYQLYRMWLNGEFSEDRQQIFDDVIIHCRRYGFDLDTLLDSSDYIKLCKYFNVDIIDNQLDPSF